MSKELEKEGLVKNVHNYQLDRVVYPEYCNTAYAKVTVRLLLENEEINKSDSESISIPI